jgi:hypothetical protein
LERFSLPTNGPIFKSESGELSNLRWDLPVNEMPSYYSRPNRKQYDGDWRLLADFTKGLAGGGPGSRWVPAASCIRDLVKKVCRKQVCRKGDGTATAYAATALVSLHELYLYI